MYEKMASPVNRIEKPGDMARHSGASNGAETMQIADFDGSFAPLVRWRAPVAPWYRNGDYFLASWLDPSIWRSAIIEAVATSCLVYISGQTSATLQNYGTAQVGAYIGISNLILLATIIYATAPASGGHINPAITFSAIFTGLCPLARGVLYLCGQTLGAALAGGVLAGVWGYERSIKYHGGGCWFDPSDVSPGQVYLNEVFASFVLLYLAYGVGLDPRQALLFGPRLGPVLVGASLGLVTFATSGIIPGYAGAQINPARCFAYAIARRDMSYQWIWWFGPAVGGLLLAVMYNLIPPHHTDTRKNEPARTTPPSAV